MASKGRGIHIQISISFLPPIVSAMRHLLSWSLASIHTCQACVAYEGKGQISCRTEISVFLLVAGQ